MQQEIGSNHWKYDISSFRNKRFWWEDGYNVIYTKSGRNAMKAICDILSLKKEVHTLIAPAYLCETEIDSWREQDWHIEFYGISKNFMIDINSLVEVLKRNSHGVLILQQYYGFETITDEAVSAIKEHMDKELIIVEDLTHSLFSNIHTSIADYYIGSLRKFYATPDGGFVVSKNELDYIKPLFDDGEIDKVALEAYKTKEKYFSEKIPSIKDRFREAFISLSKLVEINDKIYSISDVSQTIFYSKTLDDIAYKRIVNYEYVANACKKFKHITLTLPDICGIAIPLYLPIFFDTKEERDECRKYLASKCIYCPILWQKPLHYRLVSTNALYIYEHILCLPIDQRYEIDDMERMVSTLNKWLQENH